MTWNYIVRVGSVIGLEIYSIPVGGINGVGRESLTVIGPAIYQMEIVRIFSHTLCYTCFVPLTISFV